MNHSYIRRRARKTDRWTYFAICAGGPAGKKQVLRKPFKRAQDAVDYASAVYARLVRLRRAAIKEASHEPASQ